MSATEEGLLEPICTSTSHSNSVVLNQSQPDKKMSDEKQTTGLCGDHESEDEYLSAEDRDEDDSDESSKVCEQLKSMDLCDENNSTSKEMCHDDSDNVSVEEFTVQEHPQTSEDAEVEDEEEEDLNKDVIDDEEKVEDELEKRRKLEESLTEEEKEERKAKAQELKDTGNNRFRDGEIDAAVEAYTEALSICPLTYVKERSIMFSNRAACRMKKVQYEEAIKDSTSAVELHPTYLKALLRRAELYDKTEKLDEALEDYQKVLQLDPGNGMARAACMRLPQQIKDRNEKMKQEMLDKLKDLGNLVLRPFGLSTNNFKMQQDPNTGSYSMQFQQNPPGNGT